MLADSIEQMPTQPPWGPLESKKAKQGIATAHLSGHLHWTGARTIMQASTIGGSRRFLAGQIRKGRRNPFNAVVEEGQLQWSGVSVVFPSASSRQTTSGRGELVTVPTNQLKVSNQTC